jgi:hypothetical protein
VLHRRIPETVTVGQFTRPCKVIENKVDGTGAKLVLRCECEDVSNSSEGCPTLSRVIVVRNVNKQRITSMNAVLWGIYTVISCVQTWNELARVASLSTPASVSDYLSQRCRDLASRKNCIVKIVKLCLKDNKRKALAVVEMFRGVSERELLLRG